MNIHEIRSQIATLQAERGELAFQPRCRAAVESLVEGDIGSHRRRGMEHLKLQAARVAAGQAAELFHPAALAGLVALLLPDSLIAEAVATIREGLPADARTARLAAIGAELDRLEADEERIVCETGIERRADVRPEIVLADATAR